jgi:hypothetical protein
VQFLGACFFVITDPAHRIGEPEIDAMKTFALYAAADQGDQPWGSHHEPRVHDREPADYCSRDGAVALKEKIEAYWRERGQDVMLSLHNVGFHPAIRAARYDVRSDMINGMPRGGLRAPAANDRDSYSVSLVETDVEDDDNDLWIDP